MEHYGTVFSDHITGKVSMCEERGALLRLLKIVLSYSAEKTVP